MQLLTKKAPEESYHLGNVFMDFFNKPEDHVWQIDAGTGEVEMKSSVKSRSIQLARCLRSAGLRPGDVVAVSGVNHLDIHIPFYAGYLNGLPMSGIDPSFKYEEVKRVFEITSPKLAFCEVYNFADYEKAARDLGLDTMIVVFGDGDDSYANFIKKYDDNAPEHEFRVANFDTDKVFGWLISTSGTTGLPKVAAFKHSDIIKLIKISSVLKDTQMVYNLHLSTMQWISGFFGTLCMVSANQIKLQTSAPTTIDHVIDIINKYKPATCTLTPLIFNSILKHEKYCDLTCFKKIIITGYVMNPASTLELKSRMRPDGALWNLLGQTECLGVLLIPAPDGPPGNCGMELPAAIPVQLVDTRTGEVITEPNKTGELWTKGPRLTEYLNNPDATRAVFSPDGWFKTGDLVYRDANGYFFFVERISNSFRFRHIFVTPMELELVIQEHRDVVDVCVVGVPHPDDGQRAVACVQLCRGSTLTEDIIKDIVADKLPYHKHLHDGVIFVDGFPRTVSGKIARGKVLNYVLEVRKTEDSEYPKSGNTKTLIESFQRLNTTNSFRKSSTGRH